MSRLLRIYVSYFRTGAWSMALAALFFFFYGAVRTSAPIPSIFWYGVALGLMILIVTFVLTTKYADIMVVDQGLRVADIISSLRMTKKAEQPKSASIVIPCFNEASSVPILTAQLGEIASALRSLHALDNIELIFVDDGSIDDTVQQLERYLKPLELRARIKLLHHAVSKGFAESQRTGFAAATGELVISFDARSLLFHAKPGLSSPTWHRAKPTFVETLKIAGNLARSAFGNLH